MRLQRNFPLPLRLHNLYITLATLEYIISMGMLLLFSLWFLHGTPLHTTQSFALGSIDHLTARGGFDRAETTYQGASIRWTDGDSTLVLPPEGLGAHKLELTINAPQSAPSNKPMTVSVNEQFTVRILQSAQPHHFTVLVPANAIRLSDNVVRIQSTTLPASAPKQHARGVIVFNAVWASLDDQTWLLPFQVMSIILAGSLLLLILHSAGLHFLPRLLALILFAAIMLAMRHSDTRFVYRWHAVLMTLGLSVLLAVFLVILRQRPTTSTVLPIRWWIGRQWQAFVAYSLLTVIIFFPLMSHFTTQVVGGPGDTYEYMWLLQWYRDALVNNHVSPAFAPQVFYPTGYELALAEMSPANTLIGLPLTWLVGPIVTYNLLGLVSFPLTAFFTYLLAQRIGARRGPAWVAGIIFAFCVHRFFQYNAGHLNLLGTAWIPLTLYGWEGVLTRRRSWDGYVTGIGMTLAMWATWFYGTTLVVLLIIYTVIRLGIRHIPSLLQSWRALLLAGAITIALVLPLAQPYLEARQRGEMFKHSYAQLLLHSAIPREFFLPNPLHPIWGHYVWPLYRWDGGERFSTLGYTMIILALSGIVIGRKRRIVQALTVLLLVSFVISLGPELRLPNGTRLLLPVHYIYAYVPIFNNIRAWSRTVIYTIFIGALLAALALTHIPRRLERAAWLLTTTLVLLESIVIVTPNTPSPRAVDYWLRSQPGTGAVIDLPESFSGSSEYYSWFSGKVNNGGHGTFEAPLYREEMTTITKFPDVTAIRLLQRWKTDYIIIDDAAMRQQVVNWEKRLAVQPLVTKVYQRDGYTVYRLQRLEIQ